MPGINSAFAAEYERSLSVTMTRGVRPWLFSSFRISRTAAFLFRRPCKRGVQNIAVGINGAPQPVLLSLDGHDDLVKMPFVGKVAS